MKILITILLCMGILGCSNPVLFPDSSKAITERKQYKEMVEQNKTFERIAIALEKIAEKYAEVKK